LGLVTVWVVVLIRALKLRKGDAKVVDDALAVFFGDANSKSGVFAAPCAFRAVHDAEDLIVDAYGLGIDALFCEAICNILPQFVHEVAVAKKLLFLVGFPIGHQLFMGGLRSLRHQ
jgi:hypothetical protein